MENSLPFFVQRGLLDSILVAKEIIDEMKKKRKSV